MNKKILIPLILVIALLLGGVAWLGLSLKEQKKENKDMQELAELDKKEMENEYQRFAEQYTEMKSRINNDSIVAQLTREQLRTQQLLKELKSVKANDARMKGLTGVDCYQEGGLYKYTVGSSQNYQEILRLRKEVHEKFPEAFVVAFRNGKRVNVNDAVRAYNSKK